MSRPARAASTTTIIEGKRRSVFARQEATTNDTSKGPPVPAAAAVSPPTSSSASPLAGIAAAESSTVVQSSAAVAVAVAVADSSTSAKPTTPIPTTQIQPTISSTPPVVTLSVAPVETTASPVLPDSRTSSTQQPPTAASPSSSDGGVIPSSSSPSHIASSSEPPTQSVAVTSRTPSATALTAIGVSSSFETLPSRSPASATTVPSNDIIGSVPEVTTTSVISSKVAGQSTTTPSTAADANSSAAPQSIVGVVMGGVVGGLALVGILFFLWWRFYRKRGSRQSLLTPLDAQFNDRFQKYEIDGSSLGPTRRGTKWRAQAGGMYSRAHMSIGNFGSSFKVKLGGRDGTPTVNMDRGNSQFFESSPQHSRNGSATNAGAADALVHGECFRDRWDRFTRKVVFNWRLHTGSKKLTNRSAIKGTRAKKELRRGKTSDEFPRLLAEKDGERRLGSSGHRRSLSTAGLDFRIVSNPFADPYPSLQPTIPDLTKLPAALISNPFQSALDPASASSPNSSSSNYLVNVQRSRGLSQPTAPSSVLGARPLGGNAATVNSPPRYPSTATAAQPASRYPSTIRASIDSKRDTVLSVYSTSGRKAKGRSDPFDLERPELLRPAMPVTPENQSNDVGVSALPLTSAGTTSQVRVQPRVESIPAARLRIVSAADSFGSSKYSSGASAVLNDWGGTGPDLGSFAWERGPVIPPRDRRPLSNIAQHGSTVSESTDGDVGRAL